MFSGCSLPSHVLCWAALSPVSPGRALCSRGCSLPGKHTHRELCSLPAFGTSWENNSTSPAWGTHSQDRAGMGAVHGSMHSVQCCTGMQQGKGAAHLQPWLCHLQHVTCCPWKWVITAMGRVEESSYIIFRIAWPLKAHYWCVQLCFACSDPFQVLI